MTVDLQVNVAAIGTRTLAASIARHRALMRLIRALIPRRFPVRPAKGHTHGCSADFRAPRQNAIKR